MIIESKSVQKRNEKRFLIPAFVGFMAILLLMARPRVQNYFALVIGAYVCLVSVLVTVVVPRRYPRALDVSGLAPLMVLAPLIVPRLPKTAMAMAITVVVTLVF